MKRQMYLLVVLAGAFLCVCGCDKDEASAVSQNNAQAASQAAVNIAGRPATTTTAVPPPAAVVGPPPGLNTGSSPSTPGAGSSLEKLVGPRGGVYFYDDDRNFLAKDQLDFLQRAIRGYNDLRDTKHDDSPDWPELTDLSMLVQYKVVKGIPEAPTGHKFVLDVPNRKIIMASL